MVEIINWTVMDEGFITYQIGEGEPVELLVRSAFKKSKDGEAIEAAVKAFAEEYKKHMGMI